MSQVFEFKIKEVLMNKLELPPFDRLVIRSMREHEALVNLDGHRLDPQGIVLITCADCDEFSDIYGHKAELFQSNGHAPRIHPLSRNGGALMLVPQSPAIKRGRSTATDLLEEIQEACAWKKIRTVTPYIHAPCGKAVVSKINFISQMTLLFQGKQLLKNRLPGISVACFCQIDYGNSKRTYFASREKYSSWLVECQKELEAATA